MCLCRFLDLASDLETMLTNCYTLGLRGFGERQGICSGLCKPNYEDVGLTLRPMMFTFEKPVGIPSQGGIQEAS